jgi:uncharacterized BrkB/YihY/UPF0761 family membrane protein
MDEKDRESSIGGMATVRRFFLPFGHKEIIRRDSILISGAIAGCALAIGSDLWDWPFGHGASVRSFGGGVSALIWMLLWVVVNPMVYRYFQKRESSKS